MPHGILGVLQYCLPMGDMHFTAGQRRSGRHVHATARTKRAALISSRRSSTRASAKAQRGFVDEAPVAHLLIHSPDHDLGPEHGARRDRCQRLVHLLLRAHAAGEGGRGRHRQYRLAP